MAKKVTKILQGRITPSILQYDWIGATEGDYVIVQDDEGKYGRFLSVYVATRKDDKILVEDYKNKNN